MKTFLKLTAIGLIGFSLVGCGTIAKIQTAYEAVTSATVSPQAIILAADAFDVVKITATNYLRTKRCTGTNGPVCRDPALTKTIASAVNNGTDARNTLKQFLRAHPGHLGDQGVYDALTTATATLTKLLAAYQAATK